MTWLIGETEFFGLTFENWMLAMGGGLLAYIAILAYAGRRQPRDHR